MKTELVICDQSLSKKCPAGPSCSEGVPHKRKPNCPVKPIWCCTGEEKRDRQRTCVPVEDKRE